MDMLGVKVEEMEAALGEWQQASREGATTEGATSTE